MKGVNGVGDGSTINVAIYGRVSTEHEEQMSAMENQCAWYESIAQNPLLAFLKEETRFEQLLQKLRFHLLKA